MLTHHTQSASHCSAGHQTGWTGQREAGLGGMGGRALALPSGAPLSRNTASARPNQDPSTPSGGGSHGGAACLLGRMRSGRLRSGPAGDLPGTHTIVSRSLRLPEGAEDPPPRRPSQPEPLRARGWGLTAEPGPRDRSPPLPRASRLPARPGPLRGRADLPRRRPSSELLPARRRGAANARRGAGRPPRGGREPGGRDKGAEEGRGSDGGGEGRRVERAAGGAGSEPTRDPAGGWSRSGAGRKGPRGRTQGTVNRGQRVRGQEAGVGRGGGPAGALGARKSQEAWAGDSAVPDWPMATWGQSRPLAWIPYLSLSTKGEGWPQLQQGPSSGVPWLPVLETKSGTPGWSWGTRPALALSYTLWQGDSWAGREFRPRQGSAQCELPSVPARVSILNSSVFGPFHCPPQSQQLPHPTAKQDLSTAPSKPARLPGAPETHQISSQTQLPVSSPHQRALPPQ